MPVRFIKNPDKDGPELAVCTRQEFEAMADALSEKIGLRRRDMAMPVEVAEKIGRGMPIVTALREWRGLTKVRLSEISGVHASVIKRLEDTQLPPVDDRTRLALARYLDVPPGWLG